LFPGRRPAGQVRQSARGGMRDNSTLNHGRQRQRYSRENGALPQTHQVKVCIAKDDRIGMSSGLKGPKHDSPGQRPGSLVRQVTEALKGRHNPVPRQGLFRPFRACGRSVARSPGRCPGLTYLSLSGSKTDRSENRRRNLMRMGLSPQKRNVLIYSRNTPEVNPGDPGFWWSSRPVVLVDKRR
jgi:hypothetical protein